MAGYSVDRLTPLTENRKYIDHFGTYDIEAQRWRNFLMAGTFFPGQYTFHENLGSLVRFMLQNKFDGWKWYAHYGGGYDHRFILDYIFREMPGQYTVKILENSGNIIALTVMKGKRVWHFWDSFQVLKGSLKDLTTVFDVEHKKLEADRKQIEDTPETREYLKHDCMGLYEVVDAFYKLPMLQGIRHRMTTAGLAMQIFRQQYLDDYYLFKMPEQKEDFVRKAYYGGRNEIFKMTGSNVREYDVNSMYVAAMTMPLPGQSKGIWNTKPDLSDPHMFYFVQAEVTCPDRLHIPVLPYRYKGKLMFPKGRFTGVFPSPEINLAREMGYDIKIETSLMFPASEYLKQYALNCWEIRQDNPGKNPLNLTAKLLGNGLYGKFAQERERTLLTTDIDFQNGCDNGYTLVLPEYNLWRVPTYSDSPAILPYISAAITSYSRCFLYDYLRLYPDKVCYCDTDSVFLEDMEIPCSDELGAMKFEKHHRRFLALQPKFYYCCDYEGNEKIRAKGFVFEKDENDKTILPWSEKDFENAIRKHDYTVFYQQQGEKMSKLNEAIKARDLLKLVMRKRSMKTEYGKRKTYRDGSTAPYDVLELE